MKILEPSMKLTVQINRLREILENRTVSWWPSKIQLPSTQELQSAIPLADLETQWTSALQGFRIANFNSTGLRFLDRSQDKVLWSRRIDKPITEEIYKSFLESINSTIDSIVGFIGENHNETFAYEIEVCVQLLRDTFLNASPPRLCPSISWPSDAECIDLTKKVLGSPPWHFADSLSDISLTETPSGLKFVAKGERGETEAVVVSENHNEVYNAIFNRITQKDHYGDDSRFTARFGYFS